MSGAEIPLLIMAFTSAAGTLWNARMQKQAADVDAEWNLAEIEVNKVTAAEQEAERARMLRHINSAQVLRATTGGLDPASSPSFLALQSDNTRNAFADISAIRRNAGSANAQLASNALMARYMGRGAMISGMIGATSTAAGGIYQYKTLV